MRLRALLFCLCLTATPLAAQDTRTDKVMQAFEAWMADQGITEGSIAVIEDGAQPQTKGYGHAADAPVILASLSKAITGACVATLQQEGVFDLTSPISDYLDVPEGSGTIADFVSQTSGLKDDITQGKPWHLETDRTARHALATKLSLGTKRGDASFSYNNGNYAVLGAVIDAVAQKDYAADCRSLLFEPLGITTAALDPVWGPLGAWGGWSMSVGDYATFAKEWFGTDRNIRQAPLDWPHATLGGGAHYVMGAFYRNIRGRHLFWHAGLLCRDGAGDGSYFASYDGDVVVTVSYAACLPDGPLRELDGALFNAALR